MGSKTQTTQTQSNTYNPQSMNAFNSLQAPVSSTLLGYMQNPLQSGFFNARLQQSTNAANQLGQQNANALMQNLAASGFGGGNLNAFNQSMLAQNARATSANKAQGFIQNLLGQSQLQMQAAQGAMGYKPLQTGGTMQSTQTTGGLGTWLPQLVGAGLGAMTGNPFGALGRGGGGGNGMMGGVYTSGPLVGLTSNPSSLNNALYPGSGY